MTYKVNINVNAASRGKVEIDGMSINASAVNFSASSGELTMVTIKFMAEVNLEANVLLDGLILKKLELDKCDCDVGMCTHKSNCRNNHRSDMK